MISTLHNGWRTSGRHLLVAAAAVLVALLLAASSLLLTSNRADAATEGYMMNYGGWLVGSNRLPNGDIVYCIEPGAATPDGPHLDGVVSDELRSYSISPFNATGWSGLVTSDVVRGEPLRRINYVLSMHGTTTDAKTAVAVQFAIWLLRDQPGEAAFLEHHMTWVEAHGGAAEIARAHELVAEAHANAHAGTVVEAPEAPVILRGDDPHTGSVQYAAGTSSLTIEGATFENGSTTHLVSTRQAGEVTWRATPHHPEWSPTSQVRVSATWQQENISWPAELQLFQTEIPIQQHLAWAVGPVHERVQGEFDAVVLNDDHRFEPTLSTQVVQQVLGTKDVFADRITLGTGENGAEWPSRLTNLGTTEWLPVSITGTLYGPFSEKQEVSDVAPENAPIFGNAEVLVADGPGTYEAALLLTPEENGYYYWVWSITAEHQRATTGWAEFLPTDYVFTDQFGLESEMHRVDIPEDDEPADPERPLRPTGDQPDLPVGVTYVGIDTLAGTGSWHDLRQASAFGLGAIGIGAIAMIAAGVVQSRKNLQQSRSRYEEVS